MLLKIAFISLLAISCFAQTNPAKIDTLSSGIGSSTYLQSIGQSSVVTGTSVAGGCNIRQGFLQPSARFASRSIENNAAISLDVFPNSFSTQVRLKLSRLSTSPSQVELYSMNGLRVWTGEIAANLRDVQILDIDRPHTGKYILRFITNNQIITKQLIKD